MVQFLVVAVMVEAIWETFKMFWQDGKLNSDRIGSVILGMALCVGTGVDFFQIIDIPLNYPLMGALFSGVLVSRGAQFTHDLFSIVSEIHQGIKQDIKSS